MTNRVGITAQILAAMPMLRLVAVAATGYEHVGVDACRRFGVAVCNLRDWAESVPEHIFALALALRRQLLAYRSAIAMGQWQASSTDGSGVVSRRSAEGMEMTVVAERKDALLVRPARIPEYPSAKCSK
jgi:lactate dehydrogenase-like 2-hydroxyacid dehydrogenase